MSKTKSEMLTVKQTAERLGVSVPRVHQLIQEKRIEANKIGRDWIISSDALTADVMDRPTGRPPKADTEKAND